MKRTSIKDVAKAAGVSITTVSRALNGYPDVSQQTKKKIEQIAEQLNYAPDINARSLGGKSETIIGLVVSELLPTNENGFVFGLISGLYQACSNFGYEFILLATSSTKQEKLSFVQMCRKRNLSGVVVSGIRVDDPYYQEILASDIPCALIDIKVKQKNKCNISIDNVGAAHYAVKFLLAHGHQHIALINGGKSADVSGQRLNGYAQALLEAGVMINVDYIKYCDFDEDLAYRDTIALLETFPEITAFFCVSDLMAIGVIRALESIGKRVPEDISVIGFDDMLLAKYVYNGITTVRQDPFLMGKTAGAVLKKIINKEAVESQVTLPYEFIERSTVSNKK